MAYTPNPDNFIGPAQNQPYVAQPGFIGPTLPSGYKTYSSNATSGAPISSGSNLGASTTQSTPQPTSQPAPQQQQPRGGNISEGDALARGWDVNNLPSGYSISRPASTGPSQAQLDAELNSAIDSAYGPQMNYLNQAESTLRSDYPSVQSELEKQSAANSATLTANQQKAVGGVEKNVNDAKFRKEDAMAQARRLFANLQRSANARFGGTSSAGQAVSEIQGQEFQRQQGSTQRDFGKFQQESQAQLAQLDTDFNAKKLELESQKQIAMNQANRDFSAKLLQIAGLKAEAESNKATMRLQALQDLRNKVFAVNQQNAQFNQQLEAMKYQQQLSIQQQLATNGAMQNPSYVTNQASYSTPSQTTQANQPTQYMGQISSSGAYPIASLPDGRMRYSDGTVK